MSPTNVIAGGTAAKPIPQAAPELLQEPGGSAFLPIELSTLLERHPVKLLGS